MYGAALKELMAVWWGCRFLNTSLVKLLDQILFIPVNVTGKVNGLSR